MKYDDFIDTLRKNPTAKIYSKGTIAPYDWWQIINTPKGAFVVAHRKNWLIPFLVVPTEIETDFFRIELPKLERWAIVSPNNAILYWAYTRKNAHRIATKSGLPCRVAHFIEVDNNNE